MKYIPRIDVDCEFFEQYGAEQGASYPRHIYFFKNGYGASVILRPKTWGNGNILEVALLKGDIETHDLANNPTSKLNMDEDGIAKVLNDDELRELLEGIRDL